MEDGGIQCLSKKLAFQRPVKWALYFYGQEAGLVGKQAPMNGLKWLHLDELWLNRG